MKIYLLMLLSFLLSTQLYAQKIEVSVQANSGLFHYAGKSATGVSFINQGSAASENYTNNPYGNKNGFSYGTGIQVQLVNKTGFLVGLQAGYEVLKSRVNITNVTPYSVVYPFYDYVIVPINTTGHTSLQTQAIDVNPYVGYRLRFKKVRVDLLPGVDLGFNRSTYDKGQATSTGTDGTVYKVDIKKTGLPNDVRLKFGVAASLNEIGVTASYAHGLTNYLGGMAGDGNYAAHSELLRFGITYRLL